ncbi:hypothetical protein CL628_00055 [bacterium]|nr:hypothetical protein [bacterium]
MVRRVLPPTPLEVASAEVAAKVLVLSPFIEPALRDIWNKCVGMNVPDPADERELIGLCVELAGATTQRVDSFETAGICPIGKQEVLQCAGCQSERPGHLPVLSAHARGRHQKAVRQQLTVSLDHVRVLCQHF